MDVILEPEMNIYVNNKVADRNTKVYENFSVLWTMEELNLSEVIEEVKEAASQDSFYGNVYEDISYEENEEYMGNMTEDEYAPAYGDSDMKKEAFQEENRSDNDGKAAEDEETSGEEAGMEMSIIVNKSPITLKGKTGYIFVDIFDYIDIDLSKPQGSTIVTEINGRTAQYMEALHAGDVIEVYWRK